jgi:hypothetical protein
MLLNNVRSLTSLSDLFMTVLQGEMKEVLDQNWGTESWPEFIPLIRCYCKEVSDELVFKL